VRKAFFTKRISVCARRRILPNFLEPKQHRQHSFEFVIEMHLIASKPFQCGWFKGVATLSQIEQNSPITVHADDRYFKDLACSSIAEIRLIALNVTMP
jgi:hypothetical protein